MHSLVLHVHCSESIIVEHDLNSTKYIDGLLKVEFQGLFRQ